MLNAVFNYFRRSTLSEEERFLSQSYDLADLERRQRMIDRGEAPHQRLAKANLNITHYQ